MTREEHIQSVLSSELLPLAPSPEHMINITTTMSQQADRMKIIRAYPASVAAEKLGLSLRQVESLAANDRYKQDAVENNTNSYDRLRKLMKDMFGTTVAKNLNRAQVIELRKAFLPKIPEPTAWETEMADKETPLSARFYGDYGCID